MRSKLMAEFIGTFFLVFAGTGAAVVNAQTGSPGHPGVSAVFGLAVAALIYALGHVSGAHFNPAVTMGFLAGRRILPREAFLYVAVQMAGASAASFTLRLLFGTAGSLGATLPSGTWVQSWGMEFFLTFLLMLVILGAAVDREAHRPLAGLAIGGTVGLAAMFGGPVSGASMNPARSFGPALASGTWEHLWIYLTAPVLGALAAVLIHRMMNAERSRQA